MATSTFFISNIFVPLFAAVFAFLGSLAGGYLVWKLDRDNERYQTLYGPLKFNLLMMKLLTTNKEEILVDIKKWVNVEMQIDLMQNHVPPLTLKWINYRDKVRVLFEENSGLVNKDDFNLMSDFMDGCVKREIIDEGKNILAVEDERINKLLKAVERLQEKLL